MIDTRSAVSLCQLLAIQQPSLISALMRKCDIHLSLGPGRDVLGVLLDWQREATPKEVHEVVVETLASERMFYAAAQRKWLFTDRWDDLIWNLKLCGYNVVGEFQSGYTLQPIDPTIEESPAVEDDLTMMLRLSPLASAPNALNLMRKSIEHFRRETPDYNACLANARTALEIIAKDIAMRAGSSGSVSWNDAMLKLESKNLLADHEIKGLRGVHHFISEGTHQYVPDCQQEMVRLGRSLAASMLYFLLKRTSS